MRSSCGQWGGGSGVGRFGLGLTPLRHGLGAAESSLPVQAVGIGWATPHPCPSRRRRSSPQAPSPHSASESVNHMCCSLPESSSSCAVAVCLLTVAVEKGNIGNKRSFYFAFFSRAPFVVPFSFPVSSRICVPFRLLVLLPPSCSSSPSVSPSSPSPPHLAHSPPPLPAPSPISYVVSSSSSCSSVWHCRRFGRISNSCDFF